MSRSVWKGPFVEESLLKKIDKQKTNPTKKPIKTWSRKSTIIPDFVGISFLIYNGKKFIPITISEDMVGHKLGEFAPTRQFAGHTPADKKAAAEKADTAKTSTEKTVSNLPSLDASGLVMSCKVNLRFGTMLDNLAVLSLINLSSTSTPIYSEECCFAIGAPNPSPHPTSNVRPFCFSILATNLYRASTNDMCFGSSNKLYDVQGPSSIFGVAN